jgi:hypothetical protein
MTTALNVITNKPDTVKETGDGNPLNVLGAKFEALAVSIQNHKEAPFTEEDKKKIGELYQAYQAAYARLKAEKLDGKAAELEAMAVNAFGKAATVHETT